VYLNPLKRTWIGITDREREQHKDEGMVSLNILIKKFEGYQTHYQRIQAGYQRYFANNSMF
jgi:hypothetical protein